MRISYFHDEFYPSKGTDTQQVMKNLEGLARAGADVHLNIPRFPSQWLVSQKRLAEELFAHYGVRQRYPVHSFYCPIPYSRLRPEKLYHGTVATTFSAFRGAGLIYSRNVPPILTALNLGRMALYETYKPLPTAMPALFSMLRPYLRSPKFLGIITHSDVARDSFFEHGCPPEKVIALHNGFDPEDMEPRLNQQEARARLGLPADVRLLGYTGNLQASKNIPYLVDVVAGVPDAHLLLVGGKEANQRQIAAHAERVAPGRVKLAGWVAGYEVPPWLYACDALAVSPSGHALAAGNDTVLPMKLFQYLAAGRPLYVPDLPDTRELVLDGVHGRRTPPDDLEQNVRDLAELLADSVQAQTMGEACRKTAEELTWESRGRRLKAFIKARMEAI